MLENIEAVTWTPRTVHVNAIQTPVNCTLNDYDEGDKMILSLEFYRFHSKTDWVRRKGWMPPEIELLKFK